MIQGSTKFPINFWVSFTAIFALATFIQSQVFVNHDAAWILQGAKRLWDGAEFGKDVIDVNPVLAWWLQFPAIGFAELTGLTVSVAFKLWVFVIASLSLTVCWQALRITQISAGSQITLIGVFAAVFLLGSGYDFGQREHFLVILAAPYAILVAERVRNKPIPARLAILVGLMAGLGFCLKPYFLIIPVYLGLWLLIQRRNILSIFNPENITMAVVGTGYFIALFVATPDYIWRVVPEALLGYGHYNNSLGPVVLAHAKSLAPLLVVYFLLVGFQKKSPCINQLTITMFIAALGATTSSIFQLKGWSYHIYPAISFSLLCVASGLAPRCNDLWQNNKLVLVAGLSVLLFTFSLPLVRQWKETRSTGGTTAITRQLVNLFEENKQNDRFVFAFITSPRAVHSAIVHADMRWTSSPCCTYLLPSIVKQSPGRQDGEKIKKIQTAADDQINQILKDLQEKKPKVLLVDNRSSKLGFGRQPFDYINWLHENRPLVWPQIQATYTEQKAIGYFRVFVRVIP